MIDRDPRSYLNDILESCDRVLVNLKNVSLEKFRDDLNMQDVFARRFEVIGEAVKHIPVSIYEANPDIEWKRAAGFRDVIAHDYIDIEVDQMYETAKSDIPAFRAQIARVLADLEK
jgi:uncharacterized protein with HEPN domain